MSPGKKIRVAVLFGGRSAEHEVSLRSAANVMEFLDQSRYDVIPIGIDRQGNWFLGKEVFKKSLAHYKVPKLLESETWFTPEWIGRSANASDLIHHAKGLQFDVVFPVVHGTNCEDGSLQGLLELANLPFVGCGVLASAVGMDKDVAKRLAMQAGIAVAPYIVIKPEQWQQEKNQFTTLVNENLGYPVFVKPANAGSSVGITKVKRQEELAEAIQAAFRFDQKVLVEKGLNVVELELAGLESINDNNNPIISVVGEIKPKHEFYSYDAKYIDENGAELIIPASVSTELQVEAQKIAKKIFQVLECQGMARIDLFYDKDSQQIFFNEINTIPGFTQISMYPKLMEASGISYSELLTHLIELALARHTKKQKLVQSFLDP